MDEWTDWAGGLVVRGEKKWNVGMSGCIIDLKYRFICWVSRNEFEKWVEWWVADGIFG